MANLIKDQMVNLCPVSLAPTAVETVHPPRKCSWQAGGEETTNTTYYHLAGGNPPLKDPQAHVTVERIQQTTTVVPASESAKGEKNRGSKSDMATLRN